MLLSIKNIIFHISGTTITKKKIQLTAKIDDTTYVAKNLTGFREGDIVKVEDEYNIIMVNGAA